MNTALRPSISLVSSLFGVNVCILALLKLTYHHEEAHFLAISFLAIASVGIIIQWIVMRYHDHFKLKKKRLLLLSDWMLRVANRIGIFIGLAYVLIVRKEGYNWPVMLLATCIPFVLQSSVRLGQWQRSGQWGKYLSVSFFTLVARIGIGLVLVSLGHAKSLLALVIILSLVIPIGQFGNDRPVRPLRRKIENQLIKYLFVVISLVLLFDLFPGTSMLVPEKAGFYTCFTILHKILYYGL
ncbi:MAG: hypothetical protein QM669_11210 [Siphonobacter sp.]